MGMYTTPGPIEIHCGVGVNDGVNVGVMVGLGVTVAVDVGVNVGVDDGVGVGVAKKGILLHAAKKEVKIKTKSDFLIICQRFSVEDLDEDRIPRL